MSTLALLNGETLFAVMCVLSPLAFLWFLSYWKGRQPRQHVTETPMHHPPPTSGGGSADHQVSRNGALLGIHTEADLRMRLASGQYHPTDFYWKPGMANWAALATLPPNLQGAPAQPAGHRFTTKGTIIAFNIQNGTGLISAVNGVRYDFTTANWGSPTVHPRIGLLVEFEANASNALHIFPSPERTAANGLNEFYRSSDNAIVSGVCAGLAHKWNTDPIVIRIVMLFVPLGWVFYIIGAMSWTARPTK